MARETRPDVILMDIEMPRLGGLEATRSIKAEQPGVKIVILTFDDDDERVFEAIKCGAQGYLLKDIEAYQLYDMLAGLRRGEAPIAGAVAAKLLNALKRPARAAESRPPHEDLSPRERDVLRLLVEGKSNKEVAEALGLTENTVKTHLTAILEKLHLQNRIQAAVYAVRQGLADSSPAA